ncbi:MAG: TetR family transcriptional regulator [Syntrophotaleaceae bacterium]
MTNRSRESLQSDTKLRILDAAERLFARDGFHRTSIKRLASEAKVNLAAVNYHFGSKMTLIEKVVERRWRPINQQRIERLEAIRANAVLKDTGLLVRECLRAFIEPAFTSDMLTREKRCFLALAAHAFSEPDAAIRTIFINQFKAPFKLLFEVLHDALPDLAEDALFWRLHFAIGAMTHCMRLCSAGLPSSEISQPGNDLGTVKDMLLDFITSGMRAPCPGEEKQ